MMIVLLSPSKKLDQKSDYPSENLTQPCFLEEAKALADVMKEKDVDDIQNLMGLSEKLAQLNYERYQNFKVPFTQENSRPALFTFKGDVYDKMDVENYDAEDLKFAQQHIRILSGLYGLLRPLDLMQSYRLEMGTSLVNSRGKNLYDFWGDEITSKVNAECDDVVINLSSNEYFKSINTKILKAELLNISLKQLKNGQLKTIGLMAKRARGMMADFIIKNKITNVEELKKFATDGYSFQPDFSTENDWVFIKDMDVK